MEYCGVTPDVAPGKSLKAHALVNLYGCVCPELAEDQIECVCEQNLKSPLDKFVPERH